MEMHNPAHPGEIIREDCIVPLGLTVTAAAKGLGVSRQSLTELLSGRTGVSADMAIRLEKAGWSTAGAWLRFRRNMICGRRGRGRGIFGLSGLQARKLATGLGLPASAESRDAGASRI